MKNSQWLIEATLVMLCLGVLLLPAPSAVAQELIQPTTSDTSSPEEMMSLAISAPAMSSAREIASCANLDLNVFLKVADLRPNSISVTASAASCETTCTGYCGYSGCCRCFCGGGLICTALCCKDSPE